MAAGLMLTLLSALIQGVKCNDWTVTLPQNITAVRGSCVSVPCRFEVPSDYEKHIHNCSKGVVWKRGPAHLSPSLIIVPGLLVGDIRQKNCTTVFQSSPKDQKDMYFFRLQCPNFQYTFPKGVYITFQPGAAPPLLTSVGRVSEGDQLMLQCSAPVPCPSLPPALTWTAPGNPKDKYSQILESSDGQMIMKSTLTFTTSALHHNRTVTCSVSYPLAEGGSTESSATTPTLNVTYGPRFTQAELNVSGPVSERHIVTFTCRSDANPPVSSYTWFKDNRGTLVKQGEGVTLVLQVRQKNSGLYLCEAHNERGSQRSPHLALEVNSPKGCSDSVDILPYAVCGALLALYVVTVVVDVYKYRSLLMRLKQIELKGEHIYTDLKTSSVTSDYEQLQPRQPNHENPIPLREVSRQQPRRT